MITTKTAATKDLPPVRVMPTPNPHSAKFILPLSLSSGGVHHTFSRASADLPPLVIALFEAFEEASALFVMHNFLTLTKKEEASWQPLAADIQQFLGTYLQDDRSLAMTTETPHAESSNSTPSSLPIETRIKKILEEYIQPAVMQDGGLIVFDSYADGVVRLRLNGACKGCPSATLTLKGSIERLLQNMLPEEVKTVEAIEAEEDE